MDDRHLLEDAARAAGLKLGLNYGEYAWHDGLECLSTMDDNFREQPWNPLTDDGDALRLFCALPWLCIETSDLAATVCERGTPGEPSRVYLMWTEWLDRHSGDLASATRRAIVRAAAAIGQQMREQQP